MTEYTDVLGHRAKIGVLVPFTNTTVQPEYEAMAPPGVTNHVARIPNVKRRANDMAGTSNRKYIVGTRPELYGAAHHPNTDDDEQNTDRQAANFPSTRNQARAQQ